MSPLHVFQVVFEIMLYICTRVWAIPYRYYGTLLYHMVVRTRVPMVRTSCTIWYQWYEELHVYHSGTARVPWYLGMPDQWYTCTYTCHGTREYHGTPSTMVPNGTYVHVYKYNIITLSQKRLEIQALRTMVPHGTMVHVYQWFYGMATRTSE